MWKLFQTNSFRLTLNAADQLNVGGLLNKDGTSSDGGATYNLAASDNWLTGAAASSDISDASGNGITVSNVPLPTISGATYDASSGVLTVTGANFVKKFGSDNDIDVSKLSVARAGGRSYSLSSSDIELSSDTTFTVDLNDADQLKLSRLLNKNGMYSRAGTLYSFAAADGWLQGAAASEDISVSSKSLTVSNVAPVFTSGFNASSLDEQSGARQIVYKANAVHDATLTYSLKANDGDASAFEINASTGDVTLIANPDYEAKTLYSFTVIASDASGSSAERSVSLKIHNLDDTSPIFTSSSSPPPVDENLGGGQIVYTAEVADDSTVTYSLKENAGDAAQLSINAASGEVVLISNPDYETKSSFSFTVVATDALQNSSELDVSLSIKDLDEIAPATPSAPQLAAVSDTGSSDSDDITSDQTPVLKGVVEAGADVEIFADGVSLGTVTANTNGEWSYEVPSDKKLHPGSSSITIQSIDAAGNSSQLSSGLLVTVDILPPEFVLSSNLYFLDENSGDNPGCLYSKINR